MLLHDRKDCTLAYGERIIFLHQFIQRNNIIHIAVPPIHFISSRMTENPTT